MSHDDIGRIENEPVVDDRDPLAGRRFAGNCEIRIDARDSRTQIWVLPTNEELIVARQTVEALAHSKKAAS